MKIISVIPLKRGAHKGDLTYFTSLDVPPGNVVSVPLRNQKILALVTSSSDLKKTKSDVKDMEFNLKKVSANLGPSIFPTQFLESVMDASQYFAENKARALVSMIPNIFIEKYEKLSKTVVAPIVKNKVGEKVIKPEKLLFQYPFENRLSVYKTLVRESFARGKSIFLILPTESDILKWHTHLSKGIEQFTFSFHSGISSAKILKNYETAVSSSHPVLILGTAPFLSIPIPNIGTIILEHENSSAYRMISRPFFDLRIFTEIFASKIGAKFILADEMLRFETIGRKETDGLAPLHPLSFRIDWNGEILLAQNESSPDKKQFQILKDDARLEIKQALSENKNVFIFSLRKGLATETVCRECGNTVNCKKCGAPLVLYSSHEGKQRMFVCNRCQEEKDSDTACGACGSWNLVPLGIGVDTVYEEVKENFPGVKIFKLDKESAKTAKGAKDVAKEWQEKRGSILIGTEMAFFYIKDSAPLSVIASFDSLWSIPNFRMSEKIIQIILSILEHTTEKLVIQTKNENDAIIRAILGRNLAPFVREELEDRKKLEYPPFKKFIKVIFTGDKDETRVARKYLEESFHEYSPEIFSGFIAKQKGLYTTNLLIKLEPRKWSLADLSHGTLDENLLGKLYELPASFSVQVEPEDLL